MKLKSLTMMIMIVSTFVLTVNALMPGETFASNGNNDKCISSRGDGYVARDCNTESTKKDCRESGAKCSNSETRFGTLSNNPNRDDNGLGVSEKLTH
jgi:hypothetical protein